MTETSSSGRRTIAFAMGDPAGISSELAARLLALPEIREAARIVMFGDRRILADGARIAGVDLDIEVCDDEGEAAAGEGPVLVDLRNCSPDSIARGQATLAGGRFATETFRRALLFAKAGHADAVFFTPFNKAAMRLAYRGYDDDVRFISDVLQQAGRASEFNVLDTLWNARVTSHVPLSEVSRSITGERIGQSLRLTDQCLRRAGFVMPRIAVAALNSHAGDGGNFGREEIDIIGPAVDAAKIEGLQGGRAVSVRHRFPARPGRPLRCGPDHVSRSRANRDEAHGV